MDSGSMLEDIAKNFGNSLCGYGIRYDDIFRRKGQEEPADELHMSIAGSSSASVRAAMRDHAQIPHALGYHRVSILRGERENPITEDLQYDGRFIVKTGDSIDDHVSLIQYVLEQYSQKMSVIEGRRIGPVMHGPNKYEISGSAFEFAFKRHIDDWAPFLEKMLDSKWPFRMHGIISDAGGGAYQALCVDMHTGDPLDIEAGNDVMRVYLPQKSCGNAVLRLFANLQRFFDSGATCERLGWD